MNTVVSLLACWLAMLVCASARQQAPPPPTFRTGVDVVQIDVSVLDRARRPVRGLSAADFTIIEGGKPRPIVAFSAIDLPALPATAPAGADAVPPDVVRNDLPDGRIVIIHIDPFLERVMVNGRVTIADPPGIVALRTTALRVVDSLGPGDLAAVVHTMYGVAQNLTADKSRLKAAIESTAFGTNKRAEGEEFGNCNCGTCRVESITRIATALRGEPQRRKTMFFVGERLQLSPVDGPCEVYLQPATQRMVHAAQLANLTVHTVDPNGLETTNVHAGDDFRPEGGVSEKAAKQEVANRAHLIERQQSLLTVADWTGGRAVMNTNVPDASVRPILEESSAYYLLAFQTADVKSDGGFHPITVKVKRPDVQVRTRKGYYADPVTAAGDAPVSLEAISRGLLPERGLPMSIAAAPFRAADGAARVVVVTGIRAAAPAAAGLPRATAGGQPPFEPIEILTSAFQEAGKDIEWQRQRLAVSLPEQTPGQLRYESISTLTLKPGRYEVRSTPSHEHAGIVGSVHTYVDVPDFDSGALTLSGVVLLDARARDVLDAKLALQPTEFAAGSADARYTLPLQKLKPGGYVLRIEAPGSSTRDVRFSVR